MNFSVSLLFASLSFVLCEKCSETLRETFKKDFNLTDKCDGCVVLSPGVSSRAENWAGFRTGNQLFLLKNWKCREGNDFLIKPDSLAVVTNESCEITEINYTLNEQCLRKFNAEMCKAYRGNEDKEDKIAKKLNSVSVLRNLIIVDDFETLDDKTSEPASLFGRRSTGSTKVSTAKTTTFTETTDVEETSEKITATEGTLTKIFGTEETSAKISAETSRETPLTETTKIMTFASTEITYEFSSSVTSTTTSTDPNFFSTTKSSIENKNPCEPNEFFFRDHCYFVQIYRKSYFDTKHNAKAYAKNLSKEVVSLNITNLTRSCRSRHPKALGLAVETEEENAAVLKFLKTLYVYNNCTIFTSGFRKDGEDLWRGWNLKINQSVLNFTEGDFPLLNAFYCINACQSYWYLLNPASAHLIDLNFYLICERPYNPRNILPELQRQCLKLYRSSMCYNLEKHSNYCCEKDENGEIWFACPNKTCRKIYSDHLECNWTCNKTGFFFQDRPSCKGNFNCIESYNRIKYIAPATRYAVSSCPPLLSGHSTWYCSWNRTFIGKPDRSLCCNDTVPPCRDTDIFLNVWMGCPSRTIVKKTDCPPGTFLKESLVEWHCQKNGTFKGATPDYSKCNITVEKCKKKDRFGTEWKAAPGAICEKVCPPSFTGKCFWKCKENGMFDGPEPDCSRCRAAWMENIDKKIKNHSNHEEVMEIMEMHTKKEDLRIGYGHVLSLTSDCVALFKNQSLQSQISAFDKFLKSYSKILKNVAGNPNVWSSFSESNRGEFSDKILKTTQSAAFAKLESENMFSQKYNATLAKSGTDGFDFFVAYDLSVGSQFPLEKCSEEDWCLDVKEITESNTIFAAMGLVMNYTLSSLMFPQGKETEELKINAPAVTFTVATLRNGKVFFQPNVIFSISFKHTNKTRFPTTRVINRKLHKGEEPSGVYNSTLCYYYKDSIWTTEGCFVTFTSKERTNCTCNHLSTIGLLMTLHEYQPNTTLEVVSTISSAITIASLVLALLIFYFFDTVKNDRVFISQNLCFCLLIGHAMLITVMDKKFFNIPDNFCAIYAIILHYVFMAAFAWMLVEGCHLYRMLVLVFDSDVEYRWIYIFIGYGAPFLVVGITQLIGFIIKEEPYGQDELCWLKPPKYVWAFMGPVLITTLVNFCILVTAMKLAISSKRRTEKSNFTTLKLWIKGWISLSSLLGITWLFGFFYVYQNELFAYTFVVFNGLQGFFIFLFRCVLSEHYQNIFWKKIKYQCFKSKSRNRKKSENVKTETKLYAICGSKSLSGDVETKDSGYDPGLDKLEDKKYANLKSKTEFKPKENSSGVDVNINVILKPEVSEAYLRNKMIARNFSMRKSKTTWLGDSDDFPELSYHYIHSPK